VTDDFAVAWSGSFQEGGYTDNVYGQMLGGYGESTTPTPPRTTGTMQYPVAHPGAGWSVG
jgi:hypothetical protein